MANSAPQLVDLKARPAALGLDHINFLPPISTAVYYFSGASKACLLSPRRGENSMYVRNRGFVENDQQYIAALEAGRAGGHDVFIVS